MADALTDAGRPRLRPLPDHQAVRHTRDTGRFSAFVISSGHGHECSRSSRRSTAAAASPAPSKARRARAVGWIIGLFDSEPILRSSVAGQRGVSVTLEREHSAVPENRIPTGTGAAFRTLSETLGSPSIARFGGTPIGDTLTRRVTVQADGRWIVTVSRSAPSGLSSPAVQAWLVFGVWLVMGLMAFGLVQVLARGRARALRMVEEKTGQLRHQALHDALTGLPNRALIMDRAEQMLVHARRSGTEASAMFIDLDGFKGVNDTFGHPVGDELLATSRPGSWACCARATRSGASAATSSSCWSRAARTRIAERILDVLREPFDLGTGGDDLDHASIGIATGDREAAKDLLRDADIALVRGQGRRPQPLRRVRKEMHSPRTTGWRSRTTCAARSRATSCSSSTSRSSTSRPARSPRVEALLRWQHATRGLVPPTEFIALAEETGLIVQIGAWVLETACGQAARWRATARRSAIAVNVSARQLDDPGALRDRRSTRCDAGPRPATCSSSRSPRPR